MEGFLIFLYLLIGILIALGFLGFDNMFRWDIRNIPEQYRSLSRGDKFFVITLPLSWFFLAIILGLVAVFG